MDRLWIIKSGREEFCIGPLVDALPLAYAFLTDSDCHGIRIEHGDGTTWAATREDWARVEAWARLNGILGEERE